MPGVRVLTLPADQYYPARSSKQEAQPLATGCFDSMIDALTRPLTPEEAKPAPIQKQREDGNIQVSGENFLGAFEKVNELFLANRWADGLPIVPPTRELVKAMLAGTMRSPQEIIGQVAPKNGTATVEKIAVNAVMAGAKPAYFPVILAAMEGFTDKRYDLTHMQASTGSFTPVVMVDGPIAEELGFNSGIGMLGIGWRANSTVGRALQLSLLNLGQTWPQVNFMGLTGRFEAYTFFTFAEDTARSPWEPYHVSLGYKRDDSTVTVATSVTAPLVFGGGAVTPWTGQGVIDAVVARIKGAGVVWPHAQTYILALHPECAVDLAKRGYTRRSLQGTCTTKHACHMRRSRDRFSSGTIMKLILSGHPSLTAEFGLTAPRFSWTRLSPAAAFQSCRVLTIFTSWSLADRPDTICSSATRERTGRIKRSEFPEQL